MHGGGYVFGAGEAGIGEALLMAGFGGFKIISVDYRMPPDFPYPAALDDVMTVWKEVTKIPVYGDFHDFPATILTSGTRDLFLSNTVRVHRKIRRTGIEADLNIYEGQSHADYLNNPDSPETQEVFREISNFFDKHLKK